MKKTLQLLAVILIALSVASCGGGKKKKPEANTNSDLNPTETTTSSSDSDKGSKEWDKLLDDYESYMDQYVKTVKKAANGDPNAMLDYGKLYDKAEKLGNSLDGALDNNKLSTAQATRLTKIITKLAKGMDEANRLEDIDDMDVDDDDDW